MTQIAWPKWRASRRPIRCGANATWAVWRDTRLPEGKDRRAGVHQVDPDIAWAMLAALADGARLASAELS